MSNAKLATMFRDVFGSLGKKPATELYPFVRTEAPAHLRGHVVWNSETCTGCGLCAKDCPSNALEMIVVDRKAKRFVMRYRLDQCTFCAQCAASCNQDSIALSHEQWELAALTRDGYHFIWGKPDDIAEALAPKSDNGDQPEA